MVGAGHARPKRVTKPFFLSPYVIHADYVDQFGSRVQKLLFATQHGIGSTK